ncbi:MAG: hypothetical protein PVH00_11660, partial [Gemmatimonadota bacterium]
SPALAGPMVLPASARRLLETVGTGSTPDETAETLRLPVARVETALREANRAGLVCDDLGVYRLTLRGSDALRRSGAVTPSLPGSE